MSVCYDVCKITYVGPSNFSGKGVFSSIDMPRGTILFNTEYDEYYLREYDGLEPFKSRFCTLMNDANMKYPMTWSYDDIKTSLVNQEKSNICNTYYSGDNTRFIVRDVKAGDELTGKYDRMKWIVWLFLDIVGRNPFSSPPSTFPSNYENITEDLTLAFKNMNAVIDDLGYKSFGDKVVEIFNEKVADPDATDKLRVFGSALMSASREFM